ncbi:Dps family protein [Thalassospira marina]|uniref:DNA starvation/stationary phase protection protein n=1 Tax=Thalassospira marina TaxID=2048283 RepID=A0A2N3KX73_9PROT|nr:Dps family protein [Thalassospira marina]PKR55090.1 DNA starvation/stationary phase protection protein [Thalassospira marina]
MQIDIGINEQNRTDIASGLGRVLADSYALYLKTHNFHWNVTGPMFQTLHTMFEQQYTELATAVDELAERIRSLGAYAPGSFSAYSELSSITEEKGVPAAKEMIKQLVEGHETVIKTARALYPLCDEADDDATADLLTQRIQTHEKTAWMLRSLLEG